MDNFLKYLELHYLYNEVGDIDELDDTNDCLWNLMCRMQQLAGLEWMDKTVRRRLENVEELRRFEHHINYWELLLEERTAMLY